jgi:hypothetical protein
MAKAAVNNRLNWQEKILKKRIFDLLPWWHAFPVLRTGNSPAALPGALKREALMFQLGFNQIGIIFQSQLALRKKFFKRPLYPCSEIFNRDPIDQTDSLRLSP